MRHTLLLLLAAAAGATAHEVPDEVRIQAFLKPDGHVMRIFVRMPADAMIDVLFPLRDASPFLDLQQSEAFGEAGARVWVVDLVKIYENGRLLPAPRLLATRLSRKSDTPYTSYEQAAAVAAGPKLAGSISLLQDRAAVDVLIETPIESENSDFRLEPRFGRVGVRVFTTMNFVSRAGMRTFEYEGDPEPFWLNPSVAQAVRHFLKTGAQILFTWLDLPLFALCVTMVFRHAGGLGPFAVFFLLAQVASIAGGSQDLLIASLASVLAAAAIVYMGIESVVRETRPVGLPVTAAACGIIFGLGCWFRLQPVLQFGGAHPGASVAAFDLGLMFAEALLMAVLALTVRLLLAMVSQPRIVAILISAGAIHVGWRQLIARAHGLGNVPWVMPTVSPAMLAAIVAAGAIFVIWGRKHKGFAG